MPTHVRPKGGSSDGSSTAVPRDTGLGVSPLFKFGLHHSLALRLWLLTLSAHLLRDLSLRAVVRIKVLSAMPGTQYVSGHCYDGVHCRCYCRFHLN